MLLRQLFDQESCTYTYLLADLSVGKAALIDPVREHAERDATVIHQLGCTLTHIFDTHVHADHVTAAGLLRERTGAKTYASAKGAPCVDVPLAHGDLVALGGLEIRVFATPGHTHDSISFYVDGAVFTGDALLIRGCGRTDFQNGDPTQLYRSITEELFALPDETLVYPAHDYQGLSVSTIAEEKRFNPRVAGKTLDEFVALMTELKLPPPKKLAEVVPANQACGLAQQG